MEELDDLDTSWIETAEFQDNYQREPMTEIGVFFVYTDIGGSIEKITKEYHPIIDECLSKDIILQLIQTKRNCLGKKYRLNDLLSFFIGIGPDDLKEFVGTETSLDFFKIHPIFDDIVFDDSIFIFHDLNNLFFIFKEVENIVTKSILKNGGEVNNRATKKVRLSPEEYIEKKKKSLKKMIRRAKTTRKNLA